MDRLRDRIAAGFVLLVAATALSFAYRDGPLPGHTGGFGEPTCQACHAGNVLNDSLGQLRLLGIPATVTSDSSYTLTVELSRPGMAVGGFQLGARFPDGSQAGSFQSITDATKTIPGARGVEYAQHTRSGSDVQVPKKLIWTINWRAPGGIGRAPENISVGQPGQNCIVFHVAANASNDDNSEFGDHIYTAADSAGTNFRDHEGVTFVGCNR